ncbi:DegV family protein [Chloroflexota bacterium]
MFKIAVVTDTQGCLPQELVEQNNIAIVPFTVIIDDKAYRDHVDMTVDEFWKTFHEKGHDISTSPASPGAYKEVFDELTKTYDTIVCIALAKRISMAYQSATEAAKAVMEEKPEIKIEIVDTNIASGAQGLIALEVARAVKEGADLARVLAIAEEMKPKVKLMMGLASLKQLIKNGRAPRIRGYLGELLGVKPITGMVNNTGLIDPLGKTRGMNKMMAMLVDLMSKYADTSKPMHVIVHYSDVLEDGDKLKKMVEETYNCAEIYMSPYTPVMAAATGPVLALSFYSE